MGTIFGGSFPFDGNAAVSFFAFYFIFLSSFLSGSSANAKQALGKNEGKAKEETQETFVRRGL